MESNDLDDMESSLKVHEQRMNKQIGAQQALQAATNNSSASRGQGRGRRRGRGRGNGDRGASQNKQEENYATDFNGKGKGTHDHKSRSVDKSNIECFRCHRYGHFVLNVVQT